MKISIDTAKQQQDEAKARIVELKQLLASTDYVTLSDYDKNKPEILTDRQAWRDEIRQLEQTL
jgi:bifunctional ADP-heptose synthase (sugar kinase/adenylyltransferase)